MKRGLVSDDGFQFDEHLPYYLQLKSLLDEKIDSQELAPGDKLPSEAELCSELGVSRTVVRQALKEMEYEGRILKRKGKGTYVAEPKILESFVQKLSGFHEDMTAQMRETHSHVLRCESSRATGHIASMLKVRSGTKIIVLTRLRFVDGEPVQLVSSFIPHRICPDLLSTDFTNRSLYEFLQERHIFLARGFRTIEAVRATDEEARYLDLENGAPMIRIESVGYTAEGTPIEYYEAVHRGDRTRFRVELIRERSRGRARNGNRSQTRGDGYAPPGPVGIEVLPAAGETASGRGRRPKRR